MLNRHGAPGRSRAPSNLSEPRAWMQPLTRHQETHLVGITVQHFQTWSSLLFHRRRLPRHSGDRLAACQQWGWGQGGQWVPIAASGTAPVIPSAGKLPHREGQSCLGQTGVICKSELELDQYFGSKREELYFLPKTSKHVRLPLSK